MSTQYHPQFLRGPRVAVYFALIIAGLGVVTAPYIERTNYNLLVAEAESLGVPVDQIDGQTVVFLKAASVD